MIASDILALVYAFILLPFVITTIGIIAPTHSYPSPYEYRQAFEVMVEQPIVSAPPVSPLVAPLDYSSLSCEVLRSLCSERGIAWRNARGKGKHLLKAQMVEQLTSLSS